MGKVRQKNSEEERLQSKHYDQRIAISNEAKVPKQSNTLTNSHHPNVPTMHLPVNILLALRCHVSVIGAQAMSLHTVTM